MSKQELQEAAQLYCDASFTVVSGALSDCVLFNGALSDCVVFNYQSDKGNYYTAWSTMSSLIRKGFVIKYSHPPRSVNCAVSLSFIHIHTCVHFCICMNLHL